MMYIQPLTLVIALAETVFFLAIASAASRDKGTHGAVAAIVLVVGFFVVWAPILFPDLWAAYNGN
jgi:hypothetical protein